MRALGFPVKKEEVRKILGDYDREGTGKIAFEDFVEVSELPRQMQLANLNETAGVAAERPTMRLLRPATL